jgi:hypothetical protein
MAWQSVEVAREEINAGIATVRNFIELFLSLGLAALRRERQTTFPER